MKKLILTLSLLTATALGSKSQSTDFDKKLIPMSNGSITYTLIDTLDGKTSSSIFASVTEWTAKNFVSANNVIQMSDKETGKIVLKGSNIETLMIPVGKREIPVADKQRFTITFTIKEGKYRAVMSDFTIESDFGSTKLEAFLPELDLDPSKKLSTGEKTALESAKRRFSKLHLRASDTLLSLKKFVRNSAEQPGDEF